ncbi:MAG: RloB family protein [Bacteroidota bacterium]
MPRKNRSYKSKEGYFRDSFFLIIACEGAKREKEYFQALIGKNQRIKLFVLAPENEDHGKSAPKWVLDRAAKYEEKYGLSGEDQLWLVMDVDRWDISVLREMARYAKEKDQWGLAISNPCFEVWLLAHYMDLTIGRIQKCKDLKSLLGRTTEDGYDLKDVLTRTQAAIDQMQAKDSTPQHFLPKPMHTKLYQLVASVKENIK